VSRNTTYASLVPYLQPSTAYLAISLQSTDREELEHLPNPFMVVDDSSPVGTLIQARYLTDGETILQELFLFVQKNSYNITTDSLSPFTNEHMESLWQSAFHLYSSQPHSGLVRLSVLSRQDGSLNTFAPLFFCKFKNLYFEPVCPRCTSPLVQCEDNDLLESAGLPPFTSTLHRYLYCENCSRFAAKQFYVHERISEDATTVKDLNELISEFSSLVDNQATEGLIPCTTCDHKGACFGSDAKALSRIAPLSFYPFHLLPFEASTLQGTDFLALLSGADVDKLTSTFSSPLVRRNRLASARQYVSHQMPFIFDQPKRFLEILYLKLVFLSQLAHWLTQLPTKGLSPLTSLSFDSFWVDICELEDTLPYFWNFKLKPRGLILFPDNRPFPSRDYPATRLDLLALAWFFVLLRNSGQEAQQILERINDLFANASPISSEQFLSRLKDNLLPGFEPEQIFWEPQEADVPGDYKALWYSCLELGWKMVQSAFDTTQRSPEIQPWEEQIERVKKNVKEALFLSSPAERAVAIQVEGEKEEKRPSDQDAEIARVLSSIAAKWETEMIESLAYMTEDTRPAPEPTGLEPEPEAGQPAPALEETLIVTPGSSKAPLSEQPDTPPQGPFEEEEEEIPETIIFSGPGQPPSPASAESSSAPPKPQTPKAPSSPSQDKEFEKTLSMLDQELIGLVDEAPEAGAPESVGDSIDTDQKTEDDEEIPETVIIKPEDK